jgi:hypothetical protein
MSPSERGECTLGRGAKKPETKGEILIKRSGYPGSKGKQ